MEQDSGGQTARHQFPGVAVSVEEVGNGVIGSQNGAFQTDIFPKTKTEQDVLYSAAITPTQGCLSCYHSAEAVASL